MASPKNTGEGNGANQPGDSVSNQNNVSDEVSSHCSSDSEPIESDWENHGVGINTPPASLSRATEEWYTNSFEEKDSDDSDEDGDSEPYPLDKSQLARGSATEEETEEEIDEDAMSLDPYPEFSTDEEDECDEDPETQTMHDFYGGPKKPTRAEQKKKRLEEKKKIRHRRHRQLTDEESEDED